MDAKTKMLKRYEAFQSGRYDCHMLVVGVMEAVGFLLAALLTASVVSGCYALSGECIGGCKSTDASGAKDVGSAFADGKDSSDGKGLCYQDICGLEAKTQAMLKALPCLTSKKGCSYAEVNSEESKSFDFPPFAKEVPGKWEGLPGCGCNTSKSIFGFAWRTKDAFCPSTNWRVIGMGGSNSPFCIEGDGSISICKTHDKECLGPDGLGYARGKIWSKDGVLYLAYCWNDEFSTWPCPSVEHAGWYIKKISNDASR